MNGIGYLSWAIIILLVWMLVGIVIMVGKKIARRKER